MGRPHQARQGRGLAPNTSPSRPSMLLKLQSFEGCLILHLPTKVAGLCSGQEVQVGVCQEGLLIPNTKTKPPKVKIFGLSTVFLPGMQTGVLEVWQPRWNYEGKNHSWGWESGESLISDNVAELLHQPQISRYVRRINP